MLSVYMPPYFEKKSFFEQISSSLSLIVNQYENFITIGNLNINILDLINDTKNHFSDLKDTFALTNLVVLVSLLLTLNIFHTLF